jgi:hypothetical protein
MPKGANLHCHLDGSCDARFILHLAATTEDLCISSDIPLIDEASIYKAQIKFRVIPGAEERTEPSFPPILLRKYKPFDWVPARFVRDAWLWPDPYPPASSGLRLDHLPIPDADSTNTSNFDCWLHSLVSALLLNIKHVLQCSIC